MVAADVDEGTAQLPALDVDAVLEEDVEDVEDGVSLAPRGRVVLVGVEVLLLTVTKRLR